MLVVIQRLEQQILITAFYWNVRKNTEKTSICFLQGKPKVRGRVSFQVVLAKTKTLRQSHCLLWLSLQLKQGLYSKQPCYVLSGTQ